MLPISSIDEVVETKTKTNKTFKIDFENGKIGGVIDEKEALKQAVHIAIITQRYKYAIFSHSYGTELESALDEGYVKGMGRVKNAICESLLCDDRIKAVEDFEFERRGGAMMVKFRVVSSLGDVDVTEVI